MYKSSRETGIHQAQNAEKTEKKQPVYSEESRHEKTDFEREVTYGMKCTSYSCKLPKEVEFTIKDA